MSNKTKNAWPSPAYSPPGIAVSLADSGETNPSTAL